ncbi:MAG: glycosyltransferase family 4 protein [Saprospiraceae bacterium]|nr:glycosyltransferase family 4 protein [Saprospiraceae bacterium]
MKILVCMLARRGCIAYANEMVKGLQNADLKIYASRFCEEPLPPQSHLIPTFRSAFSFLFNSLFYLPIFLYKIGKDIRNGYQFIYLPVFHHWNPAIILIAKLLKAKTILTIHDAKPHPGEHALGQSWFQTLAIYWCDKIIILSEFVKNQLPHYTQNKAAVIPHPILLPIQNNIVRQFPPQPSLLFLGRIAHYKGIDLLLEAVKDFPKEKISKLTIAGLPMMDLGLPITSFPIDLHQKWISDEEMRALLYKHDILILPYREASQSGVITLGIAVSIPMIVTKVGGMMEQLTEEEAIWVEPEVESIRNGILKLIENSDLYLLIHHRLQIKRLSNNQLIFNRLLEFMMSFSNKHLQQH